MKMNTKKCLTREQALQSAIAYAGIDARDAYCLSSSCQEGLYHLKLWTPYLRYEFYVNALTGEVPGIDMEPVPCSEALCFCCSEEDLPPIAA